MPAKKHAAPNRAPRAPFTPPQLLAFFVRLLPQRQLWNLPSLKGRGFYGRLFTPIVTLWYLIFQRLHADATLEAVVADAHDGGADGLHKRLSKRLLSRATTSFSDARQRLPLAFLTEALALQARHLVALDPHTLWQGWQLCLLDGTTTRLRPYEDIPQQFTPHRNQSKTPAYWCLMRVVVGFCAATGAALRCAIGSLHQSEQGLACQIILDQAPSASLYIGDRNFGVFRIVQTARAVGSHVLVRLTQPRARKLLGRSLRGGEHAVQWAPTRHDQLQPDCGQAPVAGQLLVVQVSRRGFRPLTLYLFTTLPPSAAYPVEELVGLYGRRWHVELNLRYLKAQMHLAQLECQSATMAQKEWLAGLLAYNLVRAAMLCAALHGSMSSLELSFSAARRQLQHWLTRYGQQRGTIRRHWQQTLQFILRARLPKRRKLRPSEPRAQRYLRETFPPLIGSRRLARQQMKKSIPKS